MARPYGESIVFNILMKVLYVAYLAMYMAYAVTNYINGTGNDIVNFLVLLFISASAVVFIIANVLDWATKNADARSKIKVRLHTLRNIFKLIKVVVSLMVFAQTITDDSWNAFTIIMLIISLPTSFLWLFGEYVYVAVMSIFRRGPRRKKNAEDTDEEYEEPARRVTPVHDTIERVKQFAESELIVTRPHEVDYDSDEEEDVEDKYLGYEEDDDYSYPAAQAERAQRAEQGAARMSQAGLGAESKAAGRQPEQGQPLSTGREESAAPAPHAAQETEPPEEIFCISEYDLGDILNEGETQPPRQELPAAREPGETELTVEEVFPEINTEQAEALQEVLPQEREQTENAEAPQEVLTEEAEAPQEVLTQEPEQAQESAEAPQEILPQEPEQPESAEAPEENASEEAPQEVLSEEAEQAQESAETPQEVLPQEPEQPEENAETPQEVLPQEPEQTESAEAPQENASEEAPQEVLTEEAEAPQEVLPQEPEQTESAEAPQEVLLQEPEQPQESAEAPQDIISEETGRESAPERSAASGEGEDGAGQ